MFFEEPPQLGHNIRVCRGFGPGPRSPKDQRVCQFCLCAMQRSAVCSGSKGCLQNIHKRVAAGVTCRLSNIFHPGVPKSRLVIRVEGVSGVVPSGVQSSGATIKIRSFKTIMIRLRASWACSSEARVDKGFRVWIGCGKKAEHVTPCHCPLRKR